MGFYLRKKETGLAGGRAVLCWASDLAVLGALSWVGRGFGSGKRAGLGWAWVCLWWGLGGDLAVLGVVAGLGWARTWFSVHCLQCRCLLHVFMMSLSLCLSYFIFMCISDVNHGLEQNKAWHW